MHNRYVFFLLLTLAACGTPSIQPDAAVPDASAPDACQCLSDAGAPDCGTPDSGTPDSGSADASAVDGGEADAGPVDAGLATLGTISVDELHTELAAKDFLLIDVHIPYAGEVPGTDAHISYLDTAGLVAYVDADLDRKVVLTCLGGPMSVTAGNNLVAQGYRQIRWLVGGMNAWVAAGYTLTHNGP